VPDSTDWDSCSACCAGMHNAVTAHSHTRRGVTPVQHVLAAPRHAQRCPCLLARPLAPHLWVAGVPALSQLRLQPRDRRAQLLGLGRAALRSAARRCRLGCRLCLPCVRRLSGIRLPLRCFQCYQSTRHCVAGMHAYNAYRCRESHKVGNVAYKTMGRTAPGQPAQRLRHLQARSARHAALPAPTLVSGVWTT